VFASLLNLSAWIQIVMIVILQQSAAKLKMQMVTHVDAVMDMLIKALIQIDALAAFVLLKLTNAWTKV
jgi:hypothetical protein